MAESGAPVYDFEARTIDGENVKIGDVARGKVALVVNVASKCGFTPQYEDLEGLYEQFKDRGFTVLGFPCNQFGAVRAREAEPPHRNTGEF